jgi:predicted PP-loop superfamily ATPase
MTISTISDALSDTHVRGGLMNSSQISELIQSIRAELNLMRGVSPRIDEIYQHGERLHLIAPDRAEKSLLLGPGGRIAAELAKRTGLKITIYGADEILIKKHRLQLTKSRIGEILKQVTPSQITFLNHLQTLIDRELAYPAELNQIYSSKNEMPDVSLAFSGGVDSTASVMILKEGGIAPHAIMAELGHQFHNPKDIKQAEDWCDLQNIKMTKISLVNENNDLIERVDAGRVHPCGECHNRIMKRVKEYSIKNNYEVLVTGELLPSGRQSLDLQEKILIVHLPAALSLTKYRTERISEKSGRKVFRRKFGCNLVAKSHKKGWRNSGPSIYRVLRELEAGVLTTGQGLDYIKNIFLNTTRESGEQIE